MLKRVAIAALLGGLVLFVWESVAHMALPLGDAGIRSLGNEASIIPVLQANLPQPGFYFFPGPNTPPGATKEQKNQAMRAAMEKYRAGPRGVLIYHPEGSEPLSPVQLVTQALSDILQMLIAAALLVIAAAERFGTRWLFVALLGLLPCLAVDLPYWNWYGFPATYTLAQFTVRLVGYALAALVVAKFAAPPRAAQHGFAA